MTLNELKAVLATDKKDKNEIFDAVQSYLNAQGLTVVAKDFERPWGGFFDR
jgi:mannose-6-phosphate isomerase